MWYKVNKRYVGTQKIRPVWKYSYDFRGKSTAQIQADGWQIVTGTPSFWTYWMYWSLVRLKKDISQYMATAKKITLKYSCTISSSSSIHWGLWKTVTSSTREWLTRHYTSTYSNDWSIQIYDTSSVYSESISANQTYNWELEIDLINKTFTAKQTWKSNKTGIITDTQISNIRNNTTVMFPYVDNTSSAWWLTTVNLLIE